MSFTKWTLPTIKEDLVTVNDIRISPSESYGLIKARLHEISEESRALISFRKIESDSDYQNLLSILSDLRRFQKEIKAFVDETEGQLIAATAKLSSLVHELEVPISEAVMAVNQEASRYSEEAESKRMEKEQAERRQRETQERSRKREEDFLALRGEIAAARQVADNAERWGEKLTAEEIRRQLARFQSLDSSPGSYSDPRKNAMEVRSIVSAALLREQIRLGALAISS